ncbi:hypothetical protein BHYA_0042g00170 [Botrytis hyacinthi]|uniref:NAD(P)-binding domain-containing protein n=1 Tax=Botrytis hyacinthi TaxID=278943 RepID=A0A4Z1GT89_9HELO|nr:hypothetical protein BHYA_0042g00170 [Botrytis hyacinthi]
MASPRVLIFGGNGGIGRLIAESMLLKSWHVNSVIRDKRQEVDILQLGLKGDLRADVLVVDLARMKDEDASKILKEVKPNYIVFAAGKESYDYTTDTFAKIFYCSSGNMSNVNVVYRDAAKRSIKASISSPEVTKFLMISFPASRRKKAPWWDNTDYQNFLNETRAYSEIAEAKLNADEYLVAMAKQRNDDSPDSFQSISLRPSWLTNAPMGKTKFSRRVSRADVAAVAVSLLSRSDASGWFDLVDGNDDIESAVDNAVQNNLNSIEGEDLEEMYSKVI